MFARAFPGNRVEANRAGMTATISSGGRESTEKSVDAGRTANHNTEGPFRQRPCYDRGKTLMNLTRTIAFGAVAGGLAALVAGAATSTNRPADPVPPTRT